MSELGNMVVRYTADLAPYNQGMAAGAATAKKFGRDVESSLQGAATRADQSAVAVARSADRMAGSMGRVVESTDALNRRFDGLMRTIGGIGLGLTIAEMVSMSDAATNLSARIGLVSSSAQGAAQTQSALYDVAQRTRQQWAGVAQTYSYLAKAGQEMGASQDKILRVTENVSKAIALSGSSAESTQAALVQFSQGLASGTLRGEELNSVLEQAPRLAQALADGLGVSIGELRKLGEAGQLVPAQLLDALDKAGKQLSAEFAQMPMTVEQSFTQLQNALMKRISDMNEASGVFRQLADGVSFLATNLDYVTAALTGLVAAKAADWALNAASSFARKADAALLSANATRQDTTATLLDAEAKAAHTASVVADTGATTAALGVARAEQMARLASANASLQSAEATIAAATATGALSGSLRLVREAELQATAATAARSAAIAELAVLGQQQVRVNLEIAAATEANAVAQRALATAQTAAGAGAGLATRALGLLGGPLGAVVTVLGLGVTAWEIYSARQRDAAREAVDSSGKQVAVSGQSTQQIIDDLNKQIAKYRERNEIRDGTPAGDGARLVDQKKALADLKARNAALTPEQRAANPYNPNLLDEARLENALVAAEAAMRADRVRKLEAENQKFENQLKGVNENYEKYVTTQKALLAEGAINLTTYTARVKVAYDKWAGGAKDAEEANKAFQNALGGQMAAIEQQSKLREDALKRELANVERLRRTGQITETEALTRSYDARQTALEGELEQSKQLEDLAAGKKELAAREKYRGERVRIEAELKSLGQERANALQDQTDLLYRQQTDLDQKTLLGLEQRIVAVTQETELYGRLPSAIEAVTVARLQERREAIAMLDPMSEQLKAIDAEIEARQRLRDALYTKEATESRYDQAKKTAEEWKRVYDEIGQGLTDSFFRAFEAGKDMGQTFVDGLKNLFKTTVLRIPFQYVQAGVNGALGFSGGPGSVAGGYGSGGGMGGTSNLMQMSNLVGDAYGVNGMLGGLLVGNSAAYGAMVPGLTVGSQQAAMLAAQTGEFGFAGLSATASSGGFASGASGGMGAWVNGASGLWGAGAGIAGGLVGGALFNNKGYSSLGGSLGAVGGLAVAGSSAAAASAMGASLGSALPVVGTIAGAVLGAAIGSLIGGGGETRYGAGYNVNGGKASKGGGPSGGDPAADQVTKAIETTYGSLQSLTERYGGSLDGTGGYRAGWEVSPKKGRSFVFAGLGQDNRVDLSGEKDAGKVLDALNVQLQRSIIQGLQSANLDRPFKEYIDSIDASKLSADDVQAVLATLDSLYQFADAVKKLPFKGFADLSASAALELAKVSGGMEALTSGLNSYFQAYYSAGEQQAFARKQLAAQFAALNLAMPESKAAFRALMDGINLNDESGRKLYATLLGIAPAFAQLTEAFDAFGKQVREFQASLDLGNLSTLTPEQQYAEARRRYEETSSAALGGDADAQSKWTQIAQAFLEASRAYYASGGQYAADYNSVKGFKPDGSHANGKDYVPFDGYLAELHEGEGVLTRAENARYRQAPNWSEFGRGGSAALAAEVKALRAEVRALRDDGRRQAAARMQQAEENHQETIDAAGRQRLLLDDIANNIKP
ncbi:tape measure protein [Cupriavidus sp. SK-3]|uniref:tape measure protein n=1 Tax=Cupriavidus sp. SK-3 TaxID=1470558 RepID=UPI0012681B44|nr:tape measure protein [Cupriavidus sp. SK-3]